MTRSELIAQYDMYVRESISHESRSGSAQSLSGQTIIETRLHSDYLRNTTGNMMTLFTHYTSDADD